MAIPAALRIGASLFGADLLKMGTKLFRKKRRGVKYSRPSHTMGLKHDVEPTSGGRGNLSTMADLGMNAAMMGTMFYPMGGETQTQQPQYMEGMHTNTNLRPRPPPQNKIPQYGVDTSSVFY